jgi:hypothetical protein
MSQCAIDPNAMQVTFVWEASVFPELSQFSFHTGKRASADLSDFVDLLESQWTRFAPQQAEVQLKRIVLSQWAEVSFVGWHELYAREESAVQSVDVTGLPHQDAIVVSLLNETDVGVPLRSRRNRFYVGPLAQVVVTESEDTRMTNGRQIGLLDNMTGLDADLRTIPATVPPSSDFDGLCVSSPKTELLMDATRVTVGRRIDIHRSRGQQTPENNEFGVLPTP